MKHKDLRMAGWIALVLAAAGGVQAEDYTYTTNLDNTITLTGYTGPGGNVVIPAETNGRPVTVIGDSAFDGVTTLTGVIIPASVTNIEYSAFESCSSLTNVTIGNGVTVIGEYAFYNCANLTSITIPDSVTIIEDATFEACTSLTNVMIGSGVASIGEGVFWYCSGLTAITVDPANPVYSSSDGILIDKVNNRLIQCPEGKAGSVTVPGGVTVIGEWSFSDCVGVTHVTLPSSVTNIEDGAFWYCGLTALYFQGDAPTLGEEVFVNVTAVVYYLPGRVGWGATFGGLTTVMLSPPQIQLGPGFGMRTNGFGFTVTGSNGTVVVVEASTNLTGGGWKALKTNTLSGGSFLFRDPQVTNYSRRFYRLRIP